MPNMHIIIIIAKVNTQELILKKCCMKTQIYYILSNTYITEFANNLAESNEL